ncbi:MAG: hypothetical protein H3Z53_04725 [archaeon]|nr:hypothetical protein [archaeon]MCP8313662.1 hypothetical protein [archaeon]
MDEENGKINEERLKQDEETLKSSESFNDLSDESDILSRIVNHISLRVVHDLNVKRCCFLTGLSAYSKEPQNLFLRGPSSTGKTYNAVQSMNYFNSDDVWKLGSLSPKALIHDRGKLVDDEGKPIDIIRDRPRKSEFIDNYRKLNEKEWLEARARWDERLANSHYEIDLHNKIIVFLEAPHIETFQLLRPLLSHDAENISHKYVDKIDGKLIGVHVILSGWPATIFCTTDQKYVEDLSTRGWTITPDMTVQKYQDAIELQGKRESSIIEQSLLMKSQYDIELEPLKKYISVLESYAKINLNHIAKTVIIPYADRLSQIYKAEISRDMRDFSRFLNLIKLNALLNWMNRPILILKNEKGMHEEFTIAVMDDFYIAFEIFRAIEETTTTGISGHIITFFHNTVEPLCKVNSVHYDDLMRAYNEKTHRTISTHTIKKWCEVLYNVGWVDKVPDPDDKRKILVTAIRSEITRKSKILVIEGFFSFEMFKEWFFNLQKIYEKCTLQIIEKNEPVDLNNIDVIKDPLCAYYFSLDISRLNRETTLKTDEITRITDFHIFPNRVRKDSLNRETNEKTDENIKITDFPIFPDKTGLKKTEPSGPILLSPEAKKHMPQIFKGSEPLPIRDLLSKLKIEWKTGYEQDFIEYAMKIGALSREEAKRLFDTQIEEGRILLDSEGYWRWT